MRWFSRAPVMPVIRLSGPIGMATPLRAGLSIGSLAGPLERAFSMSRLPAVAIAINSPGGSAVQSHLIFKRIRQLAREREKRVLVFCEDVAASGGYFLALAGDEIHADPSSIVGSIGVISASFGLDKAIGKLGIERRVYTAGEMKSFLDPFQPEQEADVARLKAVQREIHDVFIGIVKDRRAGKLKGAEQELFSGSFWAGTRALELGLIDGLGDLHSRARELYGDKVRLKPVPMGPKGLLARLKGAAAAVRPGTDWRPPDGTIGASFVEGAIGAAEARALWARYGL